MFSLGHKIGMCLGGDLFIFLDVGSGLFLNFSGIYLNVFMSMIIHRSVGLNLCTLYMG